MYRKLTIGYHHPFEVRRHKITATVRQGFSILYASDFHFNAYGNFLVEQLLQTIDACNPTFILLGGDYVDTYKGLVHLQNLVQALRQRKQVYAVAGNHDYFFGIMKIKQLITNAGVCWIEKQSAIVRLGNSVIQIDGNLPTTQMKAAGFSILCLHRPIDLQPYASHYQLAFAGHLHGCQAVLWETEKGMYPGRFFYKWNRQQVHYVDCQYYISKGLGDTLPIRYNCTKDILFIEVEPASTF